MYTYGVNNLDFKINYHGIFLKKGEKKNKKLKNYVAN